jgi:hypothetical protein
MKINETNNTFFTFSRPNTNSKKENLKDENQNAEETSTFLSTNNNDPKRKNHEKLSDVSGAKLNITA